MKDGERYSFNLGPVSKNTAEGELALFRENPHKYVPLPKRLAQEHHESKAAKAQVKAGEVVVTDSLLDAFIKSVTDGEDRTPRSVMHIQDLRRYMDQWVDEDDGPLYGRDLRTVTLPDLHAGLDTWKTARRKRIIVYKSFTKYLRYRGLLTAQTDSSADLHCPPIKKPSEAEKKAKVYKPEHLQLTYAHMDTIEIRDLFLVRALTGLHVTEIQRIVTRDGGDVEPLKDGGEIAGKVIVRHKSQRTHVQSINAQCYAALERIKACGGLHDASRAIDCLKRAAASASAATGKKVERVKIANLRHSFINTAHEMGELVYAAGKHGVALSLVSQLVGHTDIATTKTFYLASDWPLMIKIPLTLKHKDDPK